MAYNPFDDVIEQDPAYMSNGGGTETTDQKPNLLKSSLKPIQKVGEFFEPGLMYMGEAMANAPYQFGKLLDTDKTTKERYQESMQDPKSFIQGVKSLYIPIEAIGEGIKYIFNPQDIKDVRVKLPTGEATPIERIGAQVGATFELLGAGELFGKIGARFGQQVADSLQKQNLKSNVDIINALPVSGKEKSEFANSLIGGLQLPPTAVRAPEKGLGLDSSLPTAKAGTIAERVTNYLNNVSPNQKVNFSRIAQDLDLTKRQVKAVLDEKRYAPYLNKVDKTAVEFEGSKAQEIKKLLEETEGTTTTGQIAKTLGLTTDSVRDVLKAKTLNNLRNKVVASKTGDMADNVRDYLKNLDEPVSYEFLANELGIDLRQASSTVNFVTKNNPELSSKIFTDYGKKDFGKGLEKPITFLKRTFDEFTTDQQITKKDLKSKYGLSNDNINSFLVKNPSYNKYIKPPEVKFKKGKGPTNIVPPILNEYKDILGIVPGARDRTDLLFFDGLLRSSSPETFGLDGSTMTKKDFYRLVMSDFAEFNPNWRQTFAKDLDTIRSLETDRQATTLKMKNYFEDMKKKYPKQMKNLNYKDYELNIAHNIPLGLSGKDFPEVGGLTGASRLSYAKTNQIHHKDLEARLMENLNEIREQGLIEKTADGKVKVPSSFNKFLTVIDEEANKLGTVIYFKLGDKIQKVGMEATPSPEALFSSFKNHINAIVKKGPNYNPKKTEDNFTKAKVFLSSKKTKEYFDDITDTKARGGAVRKAIGGTLENINQQNFTPDPAIEGDSAFQQAVKDQNLVAFNPTKIFKFFKDKIPGVYTPSKTDVPPPARDPNTNQANLPTVEGLQDYDFPLKSFTVDKIQNSNTKAAKPQDWINELQGGNASPSAELQDSGLFQYMADFERYYPNQRMTKEQLINFYEQSPIANIQVKVKSKPTETPYGMPDQEFMGRPQHENAGSAPLDAVGTNYREIVISAGKLPGEDTPFIASSHFNDPNVLVFSRVANYKNAGGDNVAVIQELQTDLLTNVRKEQERLAAEILHQKKKLQTNQDRLQRATETNDIYTKNQAQQNIDSIQKTLPQIEKLAETGLIKPYPLTVAKELIPTFEKQMMDFQSEMQDLMRAGIDRTDPEYLMKIDELQKKQFAVFEELRNLNRTSKFDDLTDGVQVPQSADTDQLQLYADNRSSYESVKNVTTFPPIPFNKQADYVDLILKATIKDAENRNINKIAIMPAEVGANNRWNKTGDAKKKFENLYDKVGVQQLKNIAKKYGGELNVEQIKDTNKGSFGVKFFNKGVDGKDVLDQTDGLDIRDAESYAAYFDARVMQELDNFGSGKVMVRREIAPGQFSEFILKRDIIETSKGYKLVDPTGEEAVIRVLEEYDPSLVDMMVLTLPRAEEATKKAPMFMFRKKEGGIIPEDRLVSITDIYGDY